MLLDSAVSILPALIDIAYLREAPVVDLTQSEL